MKKPSEQRKSNYTADTKRTAVQTRWERFRVPPAVLQKIAYVIIATAVALSWFMTPIPVAVGFTILAAIRIGIALREARKDAASAEAATPCDKSGICSA